MIFFKLRKILESLIVLNHYRLMFTTQFGFKDGWMVPIISAINNWKSLEIIHLNTSQAFDSDYELINDSGMKSKVY